MDLIYYFIYTNFWKIFCIFWFQYCSIIGDYDNDLFDIYMFNFIT